jgi:hypothetical protein
MWPNALSHPPNAFGVVGESDSTSIIPPQNKSGRRILKTFLQAAFFAAYYSAHHAAGSQVDSRKLFIGWKICVYNQIFGGVVVPTNLQIGFRHSLRSANLSELLLS